MDAGIRRVVYGLKSGGACGHFSNQSKTQDSRLWALDIEDGCLEMECAAHHETGGRASLRH